MLTRDFEPGDRVVYVDVDAIEWGPWEVVRRSGATVTVRVEESILYDISSNDLRKQGAGLN